MGITLLKGLKKEKSFGYKKWSFFLIMGFFSIAGFGQNINFYFDNAQNTNDGSNDFYEVDIMIETTDASSFKLGSGQLYFNYSTAAFGTNVKANNKIEVTYSNADGYVCGQNVDAFAIPIYTSFVINDNTTSRVSWAFSQNFAACTFAADNITGTAKKLCHLKLQYVDVNEDPMVCIESQPVFVDQFFTACGPFSGGPFDTKDCANTPGNQLVNDAYDCTDYFPGGGLDDASFSYSSSFYCSDATDQSPTITGVTGGTFTSSSSGLSIDSSNGIITISSSTPNDYIVTYTTPAGPNSNSSNVNISIIQVVAAASVDANVSCNGDSNGAATATATGGTAPYSYLWNNTATTASITGVSAGTYTVTVTDVNGCTANASVTVTEPTALTATGSVDANVSCNGGSNGVATVTPSGGTAPYTYLWSNTATTASITGVSAGTYTVTVTDVNGCTANASVTITEPTALVTTGSVDTNVSCNGDSNGAATASPSGGTAPYSYLWNNAATTASITGVGAGTYTVTITDANGCTANASVTITEPTALSATGSVDANVSCNGDSNGAATATATGGTAPYSYLWSNAATTASITGVIAGTYTVTITDANGCTANALVTITEPTGIELNTNIDSNVSCNGGLDGAATASPSGGTAPYSYLWNNAATTASITGVGAGTYTVTITDANGCTANASVTITEPTGIELNTNIDSNVSCNGGLDGAATASPSGGTAPYTYLWSTTATTASITGVAAGTYIVTVTDANGCTVNASVTITEPNSFDTTITNSSDILTVAESGADTYQWVTCDGGSSFTTISGATLQSYTVTAIGDYAVIVTRNGCSVQSACFTVSALKEKDFDISNAINLYPNPTSVFVKIELSSLNTVNVQVLDTNGRLILSKSQINHLDVIDISSLESGIYVFAIQSEIGNTIKKIIKQ